MDLMAQGERAKAEAVATPDADEPASVQAQAASLPVRRWLLRKSPTRLFS